MAREGNSKPRFAPICIATALLAILAAERNMPSKAADQDIRVANMKGEHQHE
jgi:hypothetical protein